MADHPILGTDLYGYENTIPKMIGGDPFNLSGESLSICKIMDLFSFITINLKSIQVMTSFRDDTMILI